MSKIFINYRQDDSPWNSVALYQELIKHFPEDSIFKDFNTIAPGEDFVDSIEKALDACDVLLVLISEKWLNIEDRFGKRRIDNPDDFVRIEIATALKRKIRVIPVLFDDVSLPRTDELPDDLKKIARRQYVEIDKKRFEADTTKLVKAIQDILGVSDKSDFSASSATNLGNERRRAEEVVLEKAKTERPKEEAHRRDEEKILKREAEAKEKTEEERRIKEDAEAKRKAEEDQRLKEVAIAKRREEERKLKEPAKRIKTDAASRNVTEASIPGKRDYKIPVIIASVIAALVIFIWVVNSGGNESYTAVEVPEENVGSQNDNVEIQAWNDAVTNNTLEGFKDYQQKYPNGSYVNEAQNRIDEFVDNNDWQTASTSNTKEAFQRYLDAHPSGTYASEANQKITDIDNQAAQVEQANSENAQREEDRFWNEIRSSNTIESYQSYQSKYPNGRYQGEASRQIKIIGDEEKVWNAAKAGNNLASYQSYQSKYPYGRHKNEAAIQIAAIEEASKLKAQKNIDDLARQQKSKEGDKLRSVFSNTAVKVTFQNLTAGKVDVFWIDGQGIEKNYGALGPGQQVAQPTYATHVWRFKQGGQVVFTYTATDQNGQLVKIGSNASVNPGINGRNVRRVVYGWSNQEQGYFEHRGNGQWIEASMNGQERFQFVEKGRDDWSVYLFDASRQVSIQLDLFRKEIFYSDAKTPRRPQYAIARVE